jgi:ketosteroid isomerase-like protein
MTRRLVLLSLAACLAAPAVQAQTSDEAAVRTAVERFLDVLGNRRLDELPALFAPKATMVVVRLREGQWSHTTSTSDEFLASLRAQATPTIFREPLTNVTVHVEDGHLAFVRADFTVEIGGQARSHGVDYFTLVKDGGAWKIANASYTSKQGPPPR